MCRKTECLYLSVKDLENLRNEVDENDLTRLSTLVCQNCDNLASVFDQSFKISSSPTSLPHFRNLRDLTFVGCGKLKNVCAPSIARSFINLEYVEIGDCSSIEEIISAELSGDQDDQKPFEFLKLKTLHLIDLPNFVCFSKAGDHEVHLPQLQFVLLLKLPKLSSIDHVMKAVSNLGHQHQQGFYLLESLEVEECNSLTYLFTTSMAKALVGLRRIEVSNCNNLESVVSENECPVEQSVLFPQLYFLRLKNLPKLSTLAPLTYRLKTSYLRLSCAGDITFADIIKQGLITNLFIEGGMVMEKMTTVFQGTELPDLTGINIVECAQVEQLFDLHRCSSKPLPDLKYITLVRLPKLTSVWKSAPGAILDIQNLRNLTIIGCNSLRHLITSSQANSFVNLVDLNVTDCNSFEAIVVEEEAEKEVKQVKLFPSLRDVTLKNLPKLLTRLPEHYTFGSPECKFRVDDGLLELLK